MGNSERGAAPENQARKVRYGNLRQALVDVKRARIEWNEACSHREAAGLRVGSSRTAKHFFSNPAVLWKLGLRTSSRALPRSVGQRRGWTICLVRRKNQSLTPRCLNSSPFTRYHHAQVLTCNESSLLLSVEKLSTQECVS